jgi:dipeptide/tripeptide permease
MLAIFSIMIQRGTERERKGLMAVLILTALGMLFFIFYQQMSTSLTLFSLRNVNLDFFGYQVPAGQVQALNPIWIFALKPGLAWPYTSLGRGEGGDFHISGKFAVGFAVLSIGFFIYGFSGRFASAGRIPFWWMITGYGFQSLGALRISGLGLAVVARYVGPPLRGFIMSVWFLATGISQYLADKGSRACRPTAKPHRMWFACGIASIFLEHASSGGCNGIADFPRLSRSSFRSRQSPSARSVRDAGLSRAIRRSHAAGRARSVGPHGSRYGVGGGALELGRVPGAAP